jgi:fucose 4-O-acetylase-like acetyltransferase
MAGHILQGSLESSLPRTIIYSFHMPLFIGVSGFLFNMQKAGRMNFALLLKKYRFRVILPWVFAVLG